MDFYKLDHEATMEDINNFKYNNQKIGVIVHIENEKGEILLQQRGIKSRDENGLFEDVGGKVDSTDKDFKSAIIREMKEEIGNSAEIEINDSIGIYHCEKKDINWIFVIYFGKYIKGEIKVMEPDKCQGYKFFSYQEAIDSEVVTKSCKFLTKSINDNQ